MVGLYVTILTIVGIFSLLVFSINQDAFAEKKSVFHGISDAIKYPFHSAAKTVGWDGVIDKNPRHVEPTKLKPFLASWMCQILIWDTGKIVGATSQDTFNLASFCKG